MSHYWLKAYNVIIENSLRFTKDNFQSACDRLCRKDSDLKQVVIEYGYPPLWTRPNTFETLVLTILEQQVSLASAYAAYKKLKEKLDKITPVKFLLLTDEELRGCYFSRQKIIYTRELAKALIDKVISLKKFLNEDEDVVRLSLKKLKGIGDWTVDIYLIHTLNRTDILPLGDLALVNAIRMIKKLESPTREELLHLTSNWRPHRSIATMICWHYYIRKKNIRIMH